MRHCVWDKPSILKALRSQQRQGKDLSYNALARRMQGLVSAAAHHFHSYRAAIEQAGIDYAEVTRRPRWTRQRIIALIRAAHRKKKNLNWSAVIKRRDELGLAAFAALQKRLFGRWELALAGAGLDVRNISPYQRWTRRAIIAALKKRRVAGQRLNCGTMLKAAPSLYAAAVRCFGTFDAALRSAGLDPSRFRRRRKWSRQTVLHELAMRQRKRQSLSATAVRRGNSALHAAACRLFGSFTAARRAMLRSPRPCTRGRGIG